MHRASLLLIAASLLALTGPAFADDDASNSPGATPPMVVAPAAAVGTAAPLNDRPLVAPKGAFDVHGTLPFLAVETVDFDGTGATTSTSLGISLTGGVDYGIADKLEIGGEYSVFLKPGDGTGVFNAHAAYAAYHTDKLDIAVAGDLAFDLHSNGDDVLLLGAWARYHVAPRVSLFTGNPGLPHSTELGGSDYLGATYQLAIGLNNANFVGLSLPVGVGYQATPELYAFASTTIASFAISGGGDSEYLFSDFIPVSIGGFYSVNTKLDLGAEFTDDLKNASDFYSIALTARYWIK